MQYQLNPLFDVVIYVQPQNYFWILTCVDKCSEPPKLSFGSIGKQHQRMNAMKATLVPTRSIKSSIDWKRISVLQWSYTKIFSFTGSSPRRRLLITKKRSSHGVIIILKAKFILLVPSSCSPASPNEQVLHHFVNSRRNSLEIRHFHVTGDTSSQPHCWSFNKFFLLGFNYKMFFSKNREDVVYEMLLSQVVSVELNESVRVWESGEKIKESSSSSEWSSRTMCWWTELGGLCCWYPHCQHETFLRTWKAILKISSLILLSSDLSFNTNVLDKKKLSTQPILQNYLSILQLS